MRNKYTMHDIEIMRSGQYTITDLAEIYEVSRQAINSFMKRNGIKNISKGARVSDEKKEKIRTLIDTGDTAVNIAKMMGVSENTVNRLRHEKCFAVRKKMPPVTFEIVLKFMKLRSEGKTFKEIAETTGYSQTSVKRWTEKGRRI